MRVCHCHHGSRLIAGSTRAGGFDGSGIGEQRPKKSAAPGGAALEPGLMTSPSTPDSTPFSLDFGRAPRDCGREGLPSSPRDRGRGFSASSVAGDRKPSSG